jgi:hypothetical protein
MLTFPYEILRHVYSNISSESLDIIGLSVDNLRSEGPDWQHFARHEHLGACNKSRPVLASMKRLATVAQRGLEAPNVSLAFRFNIMNDVECGREYYVLSK